jgi:hypothetical protein
MTDVAEAVRQNVARLRSDRTMTYVALSERLKARGCRIPVLGLRRIERGERRVEVGELVAFADVFGCFVDDLLRLPDDSCRRCHGAPPFGFTCNTCGAIGTLSESITEI